MKKNAIILFSGGLDSTTCLAIAKSQGFDCYALSIVYGQKHSFEIERAKAIAAKYQVEKHEIISLPLQLWGGSSLTDQNMEVPDYVGDGLIPSTYVPARNTIFLSFALSWAEVIGAQDIFIGVNEIDYSSYPDCRPEYLKAFEQVANLATKVGVEGRYFNIHAPLLSLSKANIIKTGIGLGVSYADTVSCYRMNQQGYACGTCDSCVHRKKGFLEAGISDPTPYYV